MRQAGTAALAVALLGGCGGGCNVSVPEPDSCDTPSAGQVATVEVGPGLAAPFVAWRDDDVASLTYGAQGGAMLVVKFRLTGAELPTCVAHSSTITGCPSYDVCDAGPEVLTQLDTPLRTYPIEGDAGARESQPLYLIFDRELLPGDRLHLASELAGQVVERSLWIEHATDAAVPDAAVPDAAVPDAAPAPDA